MKFFLSSVWCFGVLWFPFFALRAATLEVCPGCPLRTIQEGVQAAEANDVIHVLKGNYSEGMILIDKPLRLIGIDNPVVDGLAREHIFWIRSDDVAIEGFIIQNSGVSYISEYAGVRVDDSRNCQIQHNDFRNNTYSIYLAHVISCRIEDNKGYGNARNEVAGGNGIHLWNSKEITIRRNTMEHHRDGFYLEFSTDSVIESNVSLRNIRYGLHFMYSPRNRYFQNTFTQNQSGVAVMYSRNIEMIQNRFEKSWGRAAYGLLLKDITDSLIEENAFEGNTIGIFADGANRNRFTHNNFRNNGWAIDILGSSDSNIFTENNFIGNYFNVTTNTQNPLNTFVANYWSDYRGYDLNHDGWGDVSFRPMKIFSLWINRYPELVVMLASPVIEFLEIAERVFPLLTPKALQDKKPRMKPLASIQ